MLKIYTVFVFYLINFSCAFLKEQPSYLIECKLADPELTKCSTKQIQQLFTQLKVGIPGLKSQNSIDPFHVDRIVFDQSSTNAVSLKATLTNIVITGLGDTIVKESKMNPNDFSWETFLQIPKVRLDAHYVVDGRILLITLKGSGKMFVEAKNLELKMYTKNAIYEKENFTFYNTTNVIVNLHHIDNLRTQLENLFGGNKELEKSTNDFFNENWRDVFEALRPIVKKTIEEILLNTMKRLTVYIPANFFVNDIPKPSEITSKL